MYPRTCTRSLQFDAGHRVLGHGGKCRHLHGHRYVAHVTAQSVQLDDLSMVVDFSLVKEVVGSWIDYNWDHNMILNCDDPLLQALDQPKGESHVWCGKHPYLMPPGQNPTAEVLAEHLYTLANDLFQERKDPIKIVHVRMYETPNCWADYPAHPTQQTIDILYKNIESL